MRKVPKVNLYISDDLKARMDDTGEAVNWSGVAQRAFREAISTHQIRKDRADMEPVIERLRASKERYEERQLAAGKEVGTRWAKTDAEYYALVAVASFDPDTRDGELDRDILQWLIGPDGETDPRDWAEFWETHYGRGKPSDAFIRGFIEGATEVYDEVAEQL
jgi:hypothetical protein